ncbi:MAG: ABC transporter permease [Candidatus Sericytochromatia bacterium]|nr:ABC transporter permease [Candidatus Sericytochromatia bacterium]
MTPQDLWSTVWRALRINPQRSALTLLGVIMGVGTLVVLSSAMAGGLVAIKHSIDDASGDDVVTVTVRWRDPQGRAVPRLTLANWATLAAAAPLRQALTVPEIGSEQALAGSRPQRAQVIALPPQGQAFYQLGLDQGRFLLAEDEQAGRRVAVLGPDLAANLFAGSAIGQELRIADGRFRVVGVLSRKSALNAGNRFWSRAAVIPTSSYAELTGDPALTAILLKAPAERPLAQELPWLEHVVRKLLTARGVQPDNLRVAHSMGAGQEHAVILALQGLLLAVAGISMGVGGINIMNIMLVTVAERTREIGLRLALGARPRDVRRQFLLEAATLAGLGGAVGVLGGLLLAALVSVVMSRVLGDWPLVVDPGVLLLAFLSALGVGVVFGWYPASRAARLNPIECLRNE